MLIKMAVSFRRTIYWISRFLNAVGTVVLMAMMLLIVVDIILRNTLNKPILGSFEIVELMMAVLVFSFFANGQMEKGNIAVDMFVRRLSEKVKRALNIINYFLLTGFFALVTIQMLRETYEVFLRYDVSPTIHAPKYPFLLTASIGAMFLTLVLLIDFFVVLLNAKPNENL